VTCFTLHFDELAVQQAEALSISETPFKAKTRRRRLSLDSKTPGTTFVKPILPFLTSLVDLELAHFANASQQQLSKKTRKVHFPAFNGSALQPPSDVIEGSDQLRENCIRQLSNVVDYKKAIAKQENQKAVLEKVIQYLTQDFQNEGHILACSNSFPSESYHPPARVAKAAESYAHDLRLTLSQNQGLPCSWECRLADNCAQQIRYWLRTILNPIPDRAPSYHHSKNWNFRVCDIVVLQVSEGEESTVVEDGSLSSLVSDATSFLYAFFGTHDLDAFVSPFPLPEEKTPTEFYSTHISLKQRFISNEEWNDLEKNIQRATEFLAAMNGARFLRDLFDIVSRKPKYNGLWKQCIQESAKRLPIFGAQLEDVHLVLLQYSLEDWMPILKSLLRDMESKRLDCVLALERVEATLLLGKKSSKYKKRHIQNLRRIETQYLETMEQIAFPLASLI
jgi:hypothetical protein